jgi:hypothetical protein
MAATLLLSQARHAITFMLAVLEVRGVTGPRVFVPAYYCESALGPLRRSGAQIVFYPVTAQMEPDWDGTERLARTGPPHLFMLAHSFGTLNRAGPEALAFSRQHGALLHEDAAHVLVPLGGIGAVGDFVSFSPRKYLTVPDGAVIAVRGIELAAQAEQAAETIVNAPRRVLGPALAVFRDRYLPWRMRSGPLPALDFDFDPDPGFSSPDIWMSGYTSRRIESLGQPGFDALAARELAAIDRIERHVAATTPLVPLNRIPGSVPYFIGLRAENRAMAEAELRRLRQAGANAGTWPDMPPEVRAEPERYGAALALRNSVLRIYPRYFNRRRPLDFIDKPMAADR